MSISSDKMGWSFRTEDTVTKTLRTPGGVKEIAVAKYSPEGQSILAAQNAVKQVEQEQAQKGAAKTQEIAKANQTEFDNMQEKKKLLQKNRANANLAVFDGMAAALANMNKSEIKKLEEGQTAEAIENPKTVKAKFKRFGLMRNDMGRAIGVGDNEEEYDVYETNGATSDYSSRTGFVGRETLKMINSRLKQNGAKYIVTGIMAKQNENDETTIVLKTVGRDGKERIKEGTLEDMYKFGLDNYTKSGTAADLAENNVIDAVGDIRGVRKRADAEKQRIHESKMKTDPAYAMNYYKAQQAKWESENPTAKENLALKIAEKNAEARKEVAQATAAANQARQDATTESNKARNDLNLLKTKISGLQKLSTDLGKQLTPEAMDSRSDDENKKIQEQKKAVDEQLTSLLNGLVNGGNGANGDNGGNSGNGGNSVENIGTPISKYVKDGQTYVIYQLPDGTRVKRPVSVK